ncbi:hypothetical protein AUJ14_03200 [Candidatus Micrarchaeota archaeon CG1_02_55_22]|nr:MAG: hypothetical protein AUJ14_03200 [Candidatus Micrarchaeota archaeon CG1_02_55_22]
MAFVTVATRLPKEAEKRLRELMEGERLDKSSAARKAIELGLAEWRKENALKQLRDGKASVGEAARLAGLTIWEMLELAKEKRVDYVKLSKAELDEELSLLAGE